MLISILVHTATGVTFIALLLSLSTHVTFTLLASLASFLAALLTLIAFAIDIALYAWVKHQMGKLDGVGSTTDTAPGECARSDSSQSTRAARLTCARSLG